PSLGDGDGEGDSSDDGELFFDGEGDASDVDAFFFVDELELVAPVLFLLPVEAVDFLVVAVEACVVVAAVSSLCAHETTNAAPASTAMKPRRQGVSGRDLVSSGRCSLEWSFDTVSCRAGLKAGRQKCIVNY